MAAFAFLLLSIIFFLHYWGGPYIGKEEVKENSLFKAIDEMRHIVNTSISKTKTIRRNRTRIEENSKIQLPAIAKAKFNDEKTENNKDNYSIEAFDNIETW